MNINSDKDWLKRVVIGYRVYQEQFGNSNEIQSFIEWLFKQYGITYPIDKEKN